MHIVVCSACNSNWNKSLYEDYCPFCQYLATKKVKVKKEKVEKPLTDRQKMNLEYLKKNSPNYKIKE